jgi:hypothetical protein
VALIININRAKAQTPVLNFQMSKDTVLKGENLSFTNTSTGFQSQTQFIYKFQFCETETDPTKFTFDTTSMNTTVTKRFQGKGNKNVVLYAYFDGILMDSIAKNFYLEDFIWWTCDCQANPCDLISNGNFAGHINNVTSHNEVGLASCWNKVADPEYDCWAKEEFDTKWGSADYFNEDYYNINFPIGWGVPYIAL